MSENIEVSIECALCGGTLDIERRREDDLTFKIMPCADCKQTVKDEAFDEGKDKGYDEGHIDGFDEGKTAGIEEGRKEHAERETHL